MTPLLRLAAGAGAGIVGMSATYPLDMVRGRLTVQGERKTSQYRGIWDCTRQIIKQARPPGLPGRAPAPNTTRGTLANRVCVAACPLAPGRQQCCCHKARKRQAARARDGAAPARAGAEQRGGPLAAGASWSRASARRARAGGRDRFVEGLAAERDRRGAVRGPELCGVRDAEGRRPEVLWRARAAPPSHWSHLSCLQVRLVARPYGTRRACV